MTRLITVIICAALTAGCQTVSSSGKTASTASNELLATNMSFDLETGEIKYTLPEPALVRIRIGIKDHGALLLNLLDWEYRDAGAHVEIWNKKDVSGVIDFSSRQDLLLTLSCLPADPRKRQAYEGTIKGFRKSPRLSITFPGFNESADKSGVILSGIVPLRVTIDPQDNRWLVETKYEMSLFIDGIFLAEDEEGINPYTYQFNTKGIGEGVHVITANVVGYEGEVGTESVQIMVKNGQ